MNRILLSIAVSFIVAWTSLVGAPETNGANARLTAPTPSTEVFAWPGINISIESMVTEVKEPTMLSLALLGILGVASMRKKRKLIVSSILAIASATANAALNDVTNSISISKSRFEYNRTTGTLDTLISLRNIGVETLNTPMYVVFTSLPVSVSVNSATNISPGGHPMVQLPGDKNGFTPGATIVNFRIRFYNPNQIKFTPTLKILAFTGTAIPPDPGAAGKATLAGVDANRNDVRDDVEIYIAVNFGHSGKLRQALTDFAVATQRGILSTNEHDAAYASTLVGRAMECLGYAAPAEEESAKSILSVAINTPERFAAWMRYQQWLSGTVLRSRPIRDWSHSCTFEVDSMPN